MLSIMIQFSSLLLPYAKKTIIVWKTLFSKNGVYLAAPIIIAIPIISTTAHMGILLGFLMIVDFGTGVLVSKKNKKKEEIKNPELKKQHLITSSGLKKTGVKFLLYGSTILTAYYLQKVLKINTFNFDFSKLNFTITLIVLLFWITVEVYSIVFENAKELGLDVVDKFNKIVDIFKKGKAKIKE